LFNIKLKMHDLRFKPFHFHIRLCSCRLKVTRRLLLVEQELLTHPEHRSSISVLVGFVLLFGFLCNICRSLFGFFLTWTLYCLSLFDLWLLITPFVSSNISSINYKPLQRGNVHKTVFVMMYVRCHGLILDFMFTDITEIASYFSTTFMEQLIWLLHVYKFGTNDIYKYNIIKVK